VAAGLVPASLWPSLTQPTAPTHHTQRTTGGAAATRRLVWSRYRLTNTLRDDGPLLTACAFLRGFELLVAGTASGELKLHDAYK
jgi:hypothetical protein